LSGRFFSTGKKDAAFATGAHLNVRNQAKTQILRRMAAKDALKK